MKRALFSRLRTATLIAAAACLLGPPPAWAFVDDAHSMCMEMATPYVAKGFQIRQDYWKGDVKNGEAMRIKAQLFKGNEYWFWLGCDADDSTLELKVLDQKGEPIQAETKKGHGAIGIRVLPPKTGSFTFVFTIKTVGADKARWALAFGFR